MEQPKEIKQVVLDGHSLTLESFVAAARYGAAVELTEEAKGFIARASYSPSFGARPVKRYLQKYVETELAAMLIRGTLSDGQRVRVGCSGEQLIFETM